MMEIESICSEICIYSEIEKKTIIQKISNDADLSGTVKEIITFLIVNAPLLSSAPCIRFKL